MNIEDEVQLKDDVDEAEWKLNQVTCDFNEKQAAYEEAKRKLDEWFSIYG